MKLSKIYSLVQTAPEGVLTLQQIVGPLRKAFKPYPWIRFEVRHLPIAILGDKDVQWEFCVSGRFEPDYCGQSVCFIAVSDYRQLKGDSIWFYGKLRETVLLKIFSTIAHERIHLLQSRKAKACPRPYRMSGDSILIRRMEYMGSTNEIEAFALTEALEEQLGAGGRLTNEYRTLFGPSHPLFKKFLKKKVKFSLTMPPIRDINSLSHGGNHGRREGNSIRV